MTISTETVPEQTGSAKRANASATEVAPGHGAQRDPADARAGAGRRGACTRSRARRALWLASVALLVAAITVGATLGRARWDQDRAAASGAAALAAGRQLAVNFVTMDASTYDADTARVLEGATGQFRTEYAATVDELKPVVTANRTVSTVERAEASLVSATGDRATVIVGVVAPTTNSASSTPQKKTYRLRLELAKVGGAWKVGTLEFVS